MMNFENFDRERFPGAGRYGIPVIQPETKRPQGEFIPVNCHYTAKDAAGKNIHFFVNDQLFLRYWNHPDWYLARLSQFASLCAPDFSVYTDMPPALQIFNHYRKHWLAAYWQLHWLTVYPTISWSTPESYEWCFDGEPAGGIVSVSSVGTQRNAQSKRLFLRGYEEMAKRLLPRLVIFYGQVPKELCGEENLLCIRPYYETIRERSDAKRAAEGQAAGSA